MKKFSKVNLLNKDLMQLIGSGYFTQFLSLILLPILLRLYEPVDFGKFSLYIAISAGIGSLASLRYELSFFSFRNQPIRDTIFTLCIILAFLMPVFFLLLLFIFTIFISDLIDFLKEYIIEIYIGGVLLSLQMIYVAWHNAIGEYKKISSSRVVQSIVTSCLPIIISPFHLGSKALIYAQILALLASLILLSKNISYKIVSMTRIVWAIKKFYKNSVIGVPHLLSDVIGAIALNAAISKYYGNEILGYFNIAQRFKSIINTIGASYGILFNEKVSKTVGNLSSIKINHLKSLVLPMLLICLGFYCFSGLIIKLFGTKWTMAVQMAKILFPQFILTSVIAAFGAYFYLKNRQMSGALLGVSFTIASFIAVILPQDIFISPESPGISLATNMMILTLSVLVIHIALIFQRNK